ncbi:sugar isomerase [Enterococcus casseliflavus]|nr:sugar isomerase [Enterococcus casseliflavus]
MNQFIHQQFTVLPQLIKETLPVLTETTYEQVVFVGSGSSLNAAAMADASFQAFTGVTTSYCSPVEYQEQGLFEQSHLLVAISQTGTSIATRDCLDLAKQHNNPTVLISATLDEERRQAADTFIDLHCAEELIGPKTLGFTSTYVRLVQLGLSIGQEKGVITAEKMTEVQQHLLTATEQLPAVFASTEAWIQANLDWASLPYVTLAGDETIQALLDEGALKILETLRLPAMAYEIGEFTHGPHRLIHDNSHHIFVASGASKELTQKVATYAKQHTPNVLLLSLEDSPISLGLTQETIGLELVLTLVFQVLANEWALQTGFNPDQKVHQEFFTFVGTKN